MVISNFFSCDWCVFCSFSSWKRLLSATFYDSFSNFFRLGWFTTKYIVEEEVIFIKSGPIKKRIFIQDIKKISNTKNPLAAYALSFDRLEILYGSYETEIISPKDKEKFINLVKSKNPHIEIK